MGGTGRLRHGLAGFTVIFQGDDEHAETLPMLFSKVLMVNFMGFPDRTEVNVVRSAEPFEPLVDEDFVNQEIGKSIQSDSRPDPHTEVVAVHHAKHDEEPTRYGKNQKEGIVFLEKTGLFLMMVLMQVPKKAMHQKAVCEPSHELHEPKGSSHDEGIDED